MADQNVLDQLNFILETMPRDEAIVALLKYIFVKVAEIDGSIEVLTPVIGAMAGRLGITGPQIRRLISEREH